MLSRPAACNSARKSAAAHRRDVPAAANAADCRDRAGVQPGSRNPPSRECRRGAQARNHAAGPRRGARPSARRPCRQAGGFCRCFPAARAPRRAWREGAAARGGAGRAALLAVAPGAAPLRVLAAACPAPGGKAWRARSGRDEANVAFSSRSDTPSFLRGRSAEASGESPREKETGRKRRNTCTPWGVCARGTLHG